MGWAKSDRAGTGRCRKHPNHSQSEGVCSSCLTEKLAKLSSADRNFSFAAAGEGSFPYSPPGRGRLHRNASEVMGSVPFMMSVSDGLKKSRSVACVARNRVGEGKGSKKKSGFWWKLLKRTKKGGDGGAVVAVAQL